MIDYLLEKGADDLERALVAAKENNQEETIIYILMKINNRNNMS